MSKRAFTPIHQGVELKSFQVEIFALTHIILRAVRVRKIGTTHAWMVSVAIATQPHPVYTWWGKRVPRVSDDDVLAPVVLEPFHVASTVLEKYEAGLPRGLDLEAGETKPVRLMGTGSWPRLSHFASALWFNLITSKYSAVQFMYPPDPSFSPLLSL